MSNRVCRDCRAIYNPNTTGARQGRCPACARQADKQRGSRTQRGYGTDHQRARAAWQQRINRGEAVTCWRCHGPIVDTGWHLGHDDHDRTITRGPEHADCNLRAAGRASHNPQSGPVHHF